MGRAIKNNTGQAALFAVLFFVTISLAVTLGFTNVALNEARVAKITLDSKRAIFLVEAGMEDAVYRIKSEKNISSQEIISLNGGEVTTAINDILGEKEVVSGGNVNAAYRNLKTTMQKGSTNVSFVYGVQIGNGGLEMKQNSKIQGVGGTPGNVYSNGPITGENGSRITGDATVAGPDGSMDGVEVGGIARVHSITSSKICGDAFYTTIDASSLNFLNSPSSPTCSPLTPGTANPNSADPSPLTMPISDSQIQQFKNGASAGGVINGDCGDNGVPECEINDAGTLYLGPKKVEGNLVLTKKQTLVVTGTLYFTGYIDMNSSSGATIKCDTTFTQNSCVILTDSWMHVANNATFQGSGQAGSFIMIISTLAGCNGGSNTPPCTHHNSAMDFHNNASGAVFYAPYSMINLHNGVTITELVANKARLDNTAVIIYEQGLASTEFSSGPTGGWRIKTWQETE